MANRKAEEANAERYFEAWRKSGRSFGELRRDSENFGVREATFYDWIKRYGWHERADELDENERTARSNAENIKKEKREEEYREEEYRKNEIAREMEQRIIAASASDWKAALAWLKANFPEKWGDKQKIDVQETRVISQKIIIEGQESVKEWLRERLREKEE